MTKTDTPQGLRFVLMTYTGRFLSDPDFARLLKAEADRRHTPDTPLPTDANGRMLLDRPLGEVLMTYDGRRRTDAEMVKIIVTEGQSLPDDLRKPIYASLARGPRIHQAMPT